MTGQIPILFALIIQSRPSKHRAVCLLPKPFPLKSVYLKLKNLELKVSDCRFNVSEASFKFKLYNLNSLTQLASKSIFHFDLYPFYSFFNVKNM